MGVYYAEAGCGGSHVGTIANPFATTAQMLAGTGAGDFNNITGKFRETLGVESDVTYQQWAWRPDWIQDGSEEMWTWVNHAANIWKKIGVTTQPKILFVNDVTGKKEANLGLVDADYDWFWDVATDILYLYWTAGDPDVTGDVVEAGQRSSGALANAVSGYVLSGMRTKHGNDYGIRVNNQNAGSSEITNCHNADSRYILAITNCTGGVLAVNGSGVHNSVGYYGLYVLSQSGGTILIDGCDISASTSYNVYLNTITGGTLTVNGNTVRDGLNSGIKTNAANGAVATIRVEHNAVYGNDTAGYGIELTGSAGIVVSRNSCYGTRAQCYLAAGSTSCVINGNVLYTAAAARTCYFIAGSEVGLLSDHNDFHNTGGDLIHYSGGNYATLALYQAASGQDANSISADPLFEDATNDVFFLKANSPCINAGTTVANAPIKDIVNRCVPQGAAPDIGAYEFGPHPKPTRSVHGFRKSGRRYSRQR